MGGNVYFSASIRNKYCRTEQEWKADALEAEQFTHRSLGLTEVNTTLQLFIVAYQCQVFDDNIAVFAVICRQ